MRTLEGWLAQGRRPGHHRHRGRARPGLRARGGPALSRQDRGRASTPRTAASRSRAGPQTSSMTAEELGRRFEDAGVAAIIYTDIARDGILKGLNIEMTLALAQAVRIPVIASGGLASIADVHRLLAARLRAARRRHHGPGALRRPHRPARRRWRRSRGARPGSVISSRGSRHERPPVLKIRIIPCLDVKDGRVVKGVQFRGPARCRRSGRGRQGLRRGRRRRALLPRHHREPRGPRHPARRRQPHRRGLLHAAHRRRRRAHRRGHPRAAARRRRQGLDQHRGREGSRLRRPRPPRSSAPSASSWRSTPSASPPPGEPAAGRSSPMAAASRPGSTPSRSPARSPAQGAGELLVTSMDRDGTRSGYDLAPDAGDHRRRHRAGHRLGRRRRPRRPRGRRARGRRQRGAGGLDLPFRAGTASPRPRRTWRRPASPCASTARPLPRGRPCEQLPSHERQPARSRDRP